MMRKLVSSLFNALLIAIILISSLYIVSVAEVRENPNSVPSVLGFTPLTVISGSMSPGIETGDLVIIRNGNRNIKPGDIVTYRLGEVLVTHRVKQISDKNVKEVFITQGDANSIPDYKTVDRSQILGKYAFRIPMGGYIKACLRGLPGMLIVLGLALIIIMLEILHKTSDRLRNVEFNINQETQWLIHFKNRCL